MSALHSLPESLSATELVTRLNAEMAEADRQKRTEEITASVIAAQARRARVEEANAKADAALDRYERLRLQTQEAVLEFIAARETLQIQFDGMVVEALAVNLPSIRTPEYIRNRHFSTTEATRQQIVAEQQKIIRGMR